MRPRPARSHVAAAPPAAVEIDGAALDAALAIVREREGLDLSGYRRSTLARRLRSRMCSVGARAPAEYLDRLRTDPGETARLLDRITVKVSRFFRNPEAVEAVARALASDLARAPRPLAVWSAACGRGEEPYTLAILLAELGQPQDAPPLLATDIDLSALEAGRRGAYGPEAIGEVPGALRERWLGPAPAAGAVTVRPELRARVAFARHDLAGDPAPRPRGFDLVSCRNALIYFDLPLQRRVLGVLCDALAPGGLLWLGEAEWPSGDVAARLAPVDRGARLFRLGEGRPHA